MKNIQKHFKRNWYKYAFDTLVVIVGILIALFLTNWNENRKQQTLETKFLERLVDDLKSDSTYYNHRIIYNENAIISLNAYVNESYQIQKNAFEFSNLSKKVIVDTDDLNTFNSTYLELTSTGNLSIIRSKTLKKSITDYYRLNDELASNIHEFNNSSVELLVNMISSSPWLKYIARYHKDPKFYIDSDWQFINDPSSENFKIWESVVTFFLIRTKEHLGYFKKLKESSSNLISLINEELNKK